MAQARDGHLAEQSFQIVGLFSASQEVEDAYAFTGIDTAAAMTGAGDSVSEIAIDAAPGQRLDDVVQRLRRVAPGLDVQSWATLEPLAYAVATFFNDFIGLWLAIMFILIAIGVINTQLMAVFERTREFGLMQALGMRPVLVLADVALETCILVALGVAAGAVLAAASAAAFPHGLDLGFLGRGAELVGAGRVLYPRLDPAETALYCAIVWALAIVAALWPAWRAARIAPVEAMAKATT